MADFEPTEIDDLLESIREVYGYDFTGYERPSLHRRIGHFMEIRKLSKSNDLKRMLLADSASFEEFVQELSITVTEMFRDPDFYRTLRDKVIDRLATYPVIKIWIAGCATGQEVYSVAIVLREHDLLQRSIIYATDINQRSLMAAKEGVYRLEDMKRYTQNYLESGGRLPFSEYYTAHYHAVMFDRALRQNVVFSPHNLATDGSFNEFQLVICRNVLMYFNKQLQDKVLNLFHESLCQFGFLGLGDKESLLFYEKKDRFEEIERRVKIFRKIG